MADSDLLKVLSAVLQPELVSKAGKWMSGARSKELKGVKLIGAIYKHKGRKKFRRGGDVSMTDTLLSDVTQSISRKAMMSTYDSDFPQVQTSTALLTSGGFEELPCAKVLNSQAKGYIQNWLSLCDEEEYVQMVLATLRSILAHVNYSKTRMSEMKQTYTDPKNKLLNKYPSFHHRKCSSTPFYPPQNPPKPQIHRPISQLSQSFSQVDAKKRRAELYKGSGQVGKWVGGASAPQTQYQLHYGTPFAKYSLPPLLDFHTSMSLVRLIPNPDQSFS